MELPEFAAKALTLDQVLGAIAFGLAAFLSIQAYLLKHRRTNRFLSVYFLMFGTIQMFSFLYDLGYTQAARPFIGLFLGARLAIPAILYGYVAAISIHKEYLPRPSLKRLVSLPALVAAIDILLIILTLSFDKGTAARINMAMVTKWFTLGIIFGLIPLFNLYYLFQCVKRINQHRSAIEAYYSYTEGLLMKWVWVFVTGYLALMIPMFLDEFKICLSA